MSNFDVRDETIAQMGVMLAQAQIDKALALARLQRSKEIVEAVLEAIEWQPDDEGRQTPVLPPHLVGTLQGVVTSL